MTKSMGKGKFRAAQLWNLLIDFCKIRTLELSLEDHLSCKIPFRFDDVGGLGESQFATITEITISVVHVSQGSADTLVRTGAITNEHSIAYCLSKISAKIYQIG